MRPQPAGFVARREIEPRPEVEQDQRRLRDDLLANIQKWRRIRRTGAALVFEQLHHRRNAAFAGPARDIDVIGASLLKREPDEFAAALNAWPIIKFVAHCPPPPQPADLYCSSVTG